jgi:high-affinity nickel-transport protein
VPRARPLLVGVVHGLAGSAALMLAVLATIPSPPLAVAYLGIFGLGSIGGMVAMSALLGVPLALAGDRFARADVAIRVAAGVGSIAVGLGLAWRIGVEAGVLA